MKTWWPGTQTAFILQSRRRSPEGHPMLGSSWAAYGDYWFRTHEAATAEAEALTTRHLEIRVLQVTTTVEELPDGTPEPSKENV